MCGWSERPWTRFGRPYYPGSSLGRRFFPLVSKVDRGRKLRGLDKSHGVSDPMEIPPPV